jgi:hypothetical protein
VAFQTRRNHQIGTVEWPTKKLLPSMVESTYDWLRFEGYLGNVGSINLMLSTSMVNVAPESALCGWFVIFSDCYQYPKNDWGQGRMAT